jgi:hypothetical protein
LAEGTTATHVIEKRLVPTFSKKSPKNQELIRNHVRQQGAIHNAMALSGIAKLPPKTGLLFRGAHMKRGAVPKAGNILTVATIQRWSPALKTAEEFTQRDKAEGEMSVLFRLDTTQARDINVFKFGESEWVLLPGARYQVEEVTEDAPLKYYVGQRGIQVKCVELA